MIEKMWEILTTFTEESFKAALDQCAEKGFDTKRGIVSLEESFINLNSAKFVLQDAIKKEKLVQLPITVQKDLLSYLESISRASSNLTTGTDEVENLANFIEQLNVAIWKYGLHNLSDEVLGYQSKMNQLKNQEIEIDSLKKELKAGIQHKKSLEVLLTTTNESVEKLKNLSVESEGNKKKIEDNLAAITQVNQSAGALLATIQQNETTATQLLSTSKTSNAEIVALESKVREFYSQIDQYRNKINTTTNDAETIVKENQETTIELIDNLKMLEDQIKDKIQKATGYSLFQSFQTRQEKIAKSKKYWIGALGILVIISLSLTYFIISEITDFNVAFFAKLSMSIPLIYAIAFCTIQYGRERKLEEEYAFKSNISISLTPYKELVEKLVSDQQGGEREKFTAFIIDSITKVYTSPTDKVFDVEHASKVSSVDPLKQLEKLLKAVVEPLEPLIKALRH